MRYVLLDQVEQGEKLGKAIYTSDGRVLLEEGVTLSVGILARLRRMGVSAIFIKDERLADVEVEEVVAESTKRETIETFANCTQYIQQSGNKEFNMKDVSKTTKKIIDEILQNQNMLLSLSDIRTDDNALYFHSTNVCIMSVFVGVKLGLKHSELHDLAVGALFHDIGKVIKADNAAMQDDHMWRGFNFLRQKHEISTISAHIALQHHERVDGTGEPRQMKGDQIPLLAKIVAVTNYYDNLIRPNDGSKPLLPHEACEKILGLTNKYFDHDVVWEFLRSIAFFPTGRQVKLSTGETGIIVGQNSGLPQRPIVRIIEQVSSKFDEYEMKECDLGKETTVFIKDLL